MRTRQAVTLMTMYIAAAWVVGTAEGAGRKDKLSPELRWIEQEKIRAGYFYNTTTDKIKLLKDAGLNTIILSCKPEDAGPWAKAAKDSDMHLFLTRHFSVKAEKEGLRRCVMANGFEDVVACPLDADYWRKFVIPWAVALARLGRERGKRVDGLWMDFELYASRSGHNYYTENACYCDHCFGAFLASKNLKNPAVPPKDRARWLKDKGLWKEYHPFLEKRIEEFASELEREVHRVHPDFILGFYPTPHCWSLRGIARGLGTERVPMIAWATQTYGGGVPERIPDNPRRWLAEQGIHAYYCAGMLLRRYSAKNLAYHVYAAAEKSDGYWLFTLYTLFTWPREEPGDYHLADGTPDDYWAALRKGNDEIARLCKAHGRYKTSLKKQPEGAWYQPAYVNLEKFKVPDLVPVNPNGGAAAEQPPTRFIGFYKVYVYLKKGQKAELKVKAPNGTFGLTWRVIGPDRRQLAEGKVGLKEAAAIKFKAGEEGIYTVALDAGSAAFEIESCNAPFAIHGRRYNRYLIVSRKAERLCFYVPQGIEKFSVLTHAYGSRPYALKVFRPDGSETAGGTTEPLHNRLELEVRTGGVAGVWSLSVAATTGSPSIYIVLDRKLGNLFSLSPDLVLKPR